MIISLNIHPSIPSTLRPERAKQSIQLTQKMFTKLSKGEVGTVITKLVYCPQRKKFAVAFNHSYMDSHWYTYKGFFTSNRIKAEEEFNS